MAQVGRDLMAAARTRSPGVMAQVVNRHADVPQIGNYSLGEYKTKLTEAERPATSRAWPDSCRATQPPRRRSIPSLASNGPTRASVAPSGIMVDRQVVLADGTAYDVRWLLGKYGNSYKVRDAMVLGFWMTPFLKKLFEDYIAQNGGNPRALTAALNR